MAPASVRADGGTMIGEGSGPVKGIRIEGFVIEDACLADTTREVSVECTTNVTARSFEANEASDFLPFYGRSNLEDGLNHSVHLLRETAGRPTDD